jgi:uncharacterized damage-inducible protein DinB
MTPPTTIPKPATFRPGPVGALLDEYERAAAELRRLVERIPEAEYERIADPETADENCRSVRTMMGHVVGAGYGYADYLRGAFGVPSSRPPRETYPRADVLARFDDMLRYTRETLEPRLHLTDQELAAVRIETRWHSIYDAEQILEHGIVHLLRHRRQIERFAAEGRIAIR